MTNPHCVYPTTGVVPKTPAEILTDRIGRRFGIPLQYGELIFGVPAVLVCDEPHTGDDHNTSVTATDSHQVDQFCFAYERKNLEERLEGLTLFTALDLTISDSWVAAVLDHFRQREGEVFEASDFIVEPVVTPTANTSAEMVVKAAPSNLLYIDQVSIRLVNETSFPAHFRVTDLDGLTLDDLTVV